MASKPACRAFIPMLSAYIDGELLPAQRVSVERHVAACQECSGRAADLRAESGLVRVGMEMLADEADFKDFAQKVMARITPERPPLLERVALSLSELFTYQRAVMVSSLATATAAVVALVGVPLILSQRAPLGYASERMAVQAVSTDADAHVAPVVTETESGQAIIWLVEHPDHGALELKMDEAQSEELDMDTRPADRTQELQPKGGEL